jgi:hypothetical protein
MTVHREQYMKKEDQQEAAIRCLLLTSVSECFGHHYAHLQEIKGPVTAFGVCWSGLVWRCLAGCEHYVLTSCKTAPHNRYQPHPKKKPDQYTPNAVTGPLFS